MTYPHIGPEFKSKNRSIVVAEFLGIDHSSDDAIQLKTIERKLQKNYENMRRFKMHKNVN